MTLNSIIDYFKELEKKDEILKPINPIAQKAFMTDTTNIVKGGLSPSVKLTPKPVSLATSAKVSI
jgi:hypothetical protein